MALKEFQKEGYTRNEDINPVWQKTQELAYPAMIQAAAHYHLMPGHGIKKAGMESFIDSVKKIKNGEKKPMSEMAGALKGFDVEMGGLNVFSGLSDGKFFVVGNHSSEGPLRGIGETFLVNRAVKLFTGKEVRWVQAMQGGSSPTVVHEQIAYTADSILVRKQGGRDTVGRIFCALKEGSPVGIYPEGDKFEELHRGDERSGALFRLAAKKKIPLVLAATSYEGGRFTIDFDRINPNLICEIEKKYEGENISQFIVDFSMRRLARLLPERKRGHYSAPPEHDLFPGEETELVLT